MLYNCNIDWAVNRNLTIVENLGITSSTSMVEKMLIEERRKKVVE